MVKDVRGQPALIEFKRFTFFLKASEPLILPSYKGSTLRGGFGHAFRKVVCALKQKECNDCLLKEKCVYSYVFETPPHSGTEIMRKYKTVPHPFVLEPSPEKRRGYKPGDEIIFGLILIGRAIDYLPYFIYTFHELGNIGIGKGKGRFELKAVECEESRQSIYDSETKTLKPFNPSTLTLTFDDSDSKTPNLLPLTLNFLTPARILYDGHLTLDLEFHILIRNLLRRLSLIYYFHCNGDSSKWEFEKIIEKAKDVKVKEKDLRWYDWERYSARQDTRMKMGGFFGRISFEGDIEPFMPLIKAGEMLHVGKGTSFGLGKYEIK